MRWDIAREIRRVKPDVIVTMDPSFRYSENYINHPDHRAVADATLAAIMPTANTLLAALDLAEEGLEPHDVSEVYLSAPTKATVWIPVDEEDIQRQLAALKEHKSQMGDWSPEQTLREWAQRAAEEARANGVECEYAQGFAYVRLTEGDEGEQPTAEV